MLDHDELLPEEQAHPGFIQELRTTYQMKPEEKQLLAHVHERLAQHSHPLPPLKPIQIGSHTRSLRRAPTVSPSSRPTGSRQRWLQHLNTLVAVLFVGILVGSLVFTFSILNRTRVGSPPATGGVTNSIRVLLVPAQGSRTPSQAEMEATRTLLSQRFIGFGLQGSSVRLLTANGQPGILVELPHFGGDEQQTIDTLLGTGALAFWNTGPYDITIKTGTLFNPNQFTEYNPGGKARFTNQDIDPSVLAVFRDSYTGLPAINFMMKGDALKRFQRYTANNIGHSLTITLDGKVIESAIIQSSIAGPFEVFSADFTQQQASAIVSVLKYGPLPVELKKLE